MFQSITTFAQVACLGSLLMTSAALAGEKKDPQPRPACPNACCEAKAASAYATKSEKQKKESSQKEIPAVLDFTMDSLQGKPVNLADYRGKVILMVNTASKCGYTKQYKGLEAIYKQYKDQGFVVLGFPANDFGGQEPGSDEQIAAFCEKNYGVTFPMFSKISVKGEGKAPLYQYLTEEKTNPASAGEVKWNFEKFLISRDGQIAGRFVSKVAPESEELTGAIEKALAAK